MRKTLGFIVAALAIAGGYFVLSNYSIDGLKGLKLKPRTSTVGQAGDTSLPPARPGETVRIGTFNIQVFGDSKLNKPHVMDILARVARQFDVLAIQEVRSQNQDILPHFVDLINATGRQYDYVIGPRLGRTTSKEQYAFVFDRASIEIDRNQLYTVSDPEDLLHREPLVAWFRARSAPPEQAFTFSLVNIHTDPDEVEREVDALADVLRAVRDDGRNEDDVILLGDLNADDHHFGRLGQSSGLAWVVSGVPTNTHGNAQYDNIIFQQQATREFTGKGGVYDFMRQYNLTLEQALEVSDHLPVWAEFSVYEGGKPGHVAARPEFPRT